MNFDDENKKYGLHLPVINCRREELKLKFPWIALIGSLSGESLQTGQKWDSREGFPIADIPFICVDDEIIGGLVQEMEEGPAHPGHYMTLVDHNILDTFQKK